MATNYEPPTPNSDRSKTLSELLADKRIGKKQLSDFEIWKKSVSAESTNKILMDEYSKTYTRNLDGAVDFKIDNSATAYTDDLLRLAYIKERQEVLKDAPPPTKESTAEWFQTWKDANLNKDFEFTSMEVLRDDFNRWKPSTQDNISSKQADEIKDYIIQQHEAIRPEITERVWERYWYKWYLSGLKMNALSWPHYMAMGLTALEAFLFYKLPAKRIQDFVIGGLFMTGTFAVPFLDNKAYTAMVDSDASFMIPQSVAENITYVVPPLVLIGFMTWFLKRK